MNFADGDGFLDVIIYILIMVVGLAASAYRNYVKRKEAEGKKVQGDRYTDFPEVEPETVFDEEIYNDEPEYYKNPFEQQTLSDATEITGTNQPVVPEPTVQTINEKPILDSPVSEVESGEPLDTVETTSAEFTDDIFSDKSHISSDSIFYGDLAKDEIRDAASDEELSEEFDAKKAIIYSEIINRKYL